MADEAAVPDFAAGVPLSAFDKTSLVAGKVGDAEVLVVKLPSGYVAVDAKCTHSGAPLADGMLVGGTIRCPWHHACFDARTGAAIAAPALKALGCWDVEQRNGVLVVRGRRTPPHRQPVGTAPADGTIVIVGAGAAGAAAAAALVQLGHGRRVVLIGNDADAPYDRTKLTKEFLSGKEGDEELPLTMENLAENGVDVRLNVSALAVEPDEHRVRLDDGTTLSFGKLILATGAEPKRLTVPGGDLPHVRVLRSAADARDILDAVPDAGPIVVIGGSFIGLEAAAALGDRGCAVTVVSPDEHPFAKTLGPALSKAILAVHRKHGTTLALGRDVARITPDAVELDDGTRLPAGLVIVGIGVTPRTALAGEAGLTVHDGVVVDERLRTSHRDIFAVGDIARWPDPHSGEAIRVEHWAVAQRQGQIAAANAVGLNQRYDVVPFFWTLHFDFSIRVVGHATSWDDIAMEGDPAENAVLRFRKGDRELAVATVERDSDALAAELAMERRLGGPAATLPPDDAQAAPFCSSV